MSIQTKQVRQNIENFNKYFSQTNPVFLFGFNRGGTTLTYHIMDFHPQILKMPYDTYFFNHFWNIRKHLPPKAALKILSESAGLHRSSETLRAPESTDSYLRRALFTIIKEGDPKRIFSYMSYITYVLKEKYNNNITWWAEKTNNHIAYSSKLKKMFPKCKFIIPVRDPRAVIASELGALKNTNKSPKNITSYCKKVSLNLNKRLEKALLIKKEYPNDTLISKYEDLVSSPEEHVNKFCHFLGLSSLDRTYLRERLSNIGYIYESKSGVNRRKGVDTRSIDRWKNILAQKDIDVIEQITKLTIKKVGYEFK